MYLRSKQLRRPPINVKTRSSTACYKLSKTRSLRGWCRTTFADRIIPARITFSSRRRPAVALSKTPPYSNCRIVSTHRAGIWTASTSNRRSLPLSMPRTRLSQPGILSSLQNLGSRRAAVATQLRCLITALSTIRYKLSLIIRSSSARARRAPTRSPIRRLNMLVWLLANRRLCPCVQAGQISQQQAASANSLSCR